MKPSLRLEALAGRAKGGDQERASQRLIEVLRPHAGLVLAGYWPIRGEIDPRPAMAAHQGPVCLPVTPPKGNALTFLRWQGTPMVKGLFGTFHPDDSNPQMRPDIVIVPLAGFDRHGARLGYGGGYYDRTLMALRAKGPVLAIGFAFAGQELSRIPTELTDEPLDLIVTDQDVIVPNH